MPNGFEFEQAFDRNIGWITEAELQTLRRKRVAIGGLGGCGGVYVTTLARLGVGKLSIADFDRFELANFNRQVGAFVSTIGRPKIDVVREMALEINPEMEVRAFPNGVRESEIDSFLDGADLFLDALDILALDIRRKVHARCRALGIPAICAVPAGMGVSLLVFSPNGMSLEDWFCFDDAEPGMERVNMFVGAAPIPLYSEYLVDPSRFDIVAGVAPSTGLACELCAGVATAQAAKILLRRGPIEAVPSYLQFDPFVLEFRKGVIPEGNRDPGQRERLEQGYRAFAARKRELDACSP
jgi:molybdopterin/thiamine biosynthesis adenylyltransferase